MLRRKFHHYPSQCGGSSNTLEPPPIPEVKIINGTDYTELDKEISLLGYSDDVKRIINEIYHLFDANNVPDEDRRTIAQVLNYISLTAKKPVEENLSTWVPVHLGEAVVGETVRILPDAYTSTSGMKHNNLVGTIVAIRGGRIVVQYSGRADGVGHTHHPSKIEALRTNK